jgi:antitoxin component YwqK of YwqJK toxin-antitoxin module
MKIKSYILIAASIVFLSSCTENAVKETEINTTEPNIVSSDSITEKGDEDASFEAEDTYEANLLPDGPFESYYPNKNIKVKGNVVGGKREGVWTSYHLNGNKQSENEYKAGVLNGKTVTIFENGQIMYIGYYLDGEYDGQWFFYTKEGELSKEIIYNKGKVVKTTEGKDFNK